MIIIIIIITSTTTTTTNCQTSPRSFWCGLQSGPSTEHLRAWEQRPQVADTEMPPHASFMASPALQISLPPFLSVFSSFLKHRGTRAQRSPLSPLLLVVFGTCPNRLRFKPGKKQRSLGTSVFPTTAGMHAREHPQNLKIHGPSLQFHGFCVVAKGSSRSVAHQMKPLLSCLAMCVVLRMPHWVLRFMNPFRQVSSTTPCCVSLDHLPCSDRGAYQSLSLQLHCSFLWNKTSQTFFPMKMKHLPRVAK